MLETISDLTLLWNRSLTIIERKLDDRRIFDSFFDGSYPVSINGNIVTIVVNSDLAKTLLESKYKELIDSSILEASGTNFISSFITEDEKGSYGDKERHKPSFFSGASLNNKYTFDNFVVGNCNRQAYQASLMISSNPGKMYNPLLIYSASGLGKTHLLEAIGNTFTEDALAKGRKAKALYISASDFVDEYIKFAKGYNEDQSLASYFKEEVDMFLVDDIQYLVGKKKTMEMFFTIFTILSSAEKQIVITSDQAPENLDGLDERLKTRFQQGLVLSMTRPDLQTSEKILWQKIVANGLDPNDFDEDVITFLAERFSSSVRELEGALNRLIFASINLDRNKHVDLNVAMSAMQGLIDIREDKARLSETKIINSVASYYGLTAPQLTGKMRTAQIAQARHVAMYLIRDLLNTPYTKIGLVFGGKDHATVMNGVSKVEKLLSSNDEMGKAIKELKDKLSH